MAQESESPSLESGDPPEESRNQPEPPETQAQPRKPIPRPDPTRCGDWEIGGRRIDS